MNELEEIMNGKHEIKHLKIDNDTLSFNTELDNYDWNLTPRDIEMIIYTLQKDKNNLQSKIDKAIEFVESMEYCGQEDYFYDNKSKDPCGNDNTFNDSKNKLLDILKEDK